MFNLFCSGKEICLMGYKIFLANYFKLIIAAMKVLYFWYFPGIRIFNILTVKT